MEYRDGQSLDEWVRDSFVWHLPILFIGSVGIAVRHIAPYLENKLTDSPVLVMDDAGSYVIPILSGHVGGANELAREIASYVGAKAVITTATDVFHKFAIDVFAKEHGLGIYNQDAIRIVSKKVLDGKTIRMKCSSMPEPLEASVREYLRSSQVELVEERREDDGRDAVRDGFEEEVYITTKKELDNLEEAEKLSDTTLYLYPLQYVIGIGCVQGKSKEELFDFIEEMLRELESHQKTKGDIKKEIYALASIDRKAYEPGLLAVSAYYKCPLLTFSKEELETVTKVSDESEFVCRMVGIGNVCERAALYAAGEGAELLMKKVKRNGMTLAIAKRRPGIGGYYG